MGGVAWSREEDQLLRKCIERHGEGKWHRIPLLAGLQRCRKSCRLRWLNYLRPNIKRGNFTDEEVEQIIHLHNVHGNRWSLIASKLSGRTANDVKNYWNCHLSKKLSLNTPIKSSDDHTSTQNPIQHVNTTSTTMDNKLGHIEGSMYGTSRPSNPRVTSTSSLGEFVPSVHDTSSYNINDPMVIEKEDNDKLLYDEEHTMMMIEEFSEDIIDLENMKMSRDDQSVWKWNFDDLTFDMQFWTDFL